MEISTGKIILICGGYLLIVISLLPLIRNDNWTFRIFEYPRWQKLIINVILLSAFVSLLSFQNTHDYIFAGLLTANLFYLVYQVFPYTLFASNQIKKGIHKNTNRKFSLYIFNVFQDNRNVRACLKSIAEKNPDLVLLVETDSWWKNELDQQLTKEYPHRMGLALDNTYGMLLYSKFELIDSEVKFLVEDDVPSIHTFVRLPSGDMFRLYGIHPTPPVPTENPRSTERDAEILLVAKAARESKVPVVVAGDLNDVAWSYTTELFLKVSQLLDPRRGRGFYNTFHARYWFLRWPLDHVFCSKHFALCGLQRLPAIGSDHFAMFITLCFEEEAEKGNTARRLPSDQEDMKLAEEKIQEAR